MEHDVPRMQWGTLSKCDEALRRVQQILTTGLGAVVIDPRCLCLRLRLIVTTGLGAVVIERVLS